MSIFIYLGTASREGEIEVKYKVLDQAKEFRIFSPMGFGK